MTAANTATPADATTPAGPPDAEADIQPDALAIDLRTAVMRTSRRLRIEATGDVITPGQYTVLAHLNTASQTLRELAEREHVQAPSMTRIVNALTEQGFVARQAHPGDGRQVQISITPAGQDVLAEARSQRTAWLAQRVAGLSEQDRLVLSRAAHIMQEMSAK
ncbi:MarR family winged helix-turn-helix transcriptional regulator [Paenarthrobacter sp. NPDC090520]|uniref:MarR family winged helix-turn-helix transcriptional regulator n=1 Tax=Paenarthrobacter sp. NPDC090520 TaxID=3364382 RepID=UPI0038170A93